MVLVLQKIASYGWFGKRPHRSPWTIFSFLILISPWLCICADLCHKCPECSRTRWCLWTLSHISHLPSTSCCQRQPGSFPARVQTALGGKKQLLVGSQSAQTLPVLLQGSAPQAKSGEWWVLWVIHPKTLQDNLTACLAKKISKRRLKLGIKKGKKKTLKWDLTKEMKSQELQSLNF